MKYAAGNLGILKYMGGKVVLQKLGRVTKVF
jgi:hypothetical protein